MAALARRDLKDAAAHAEKGIRLADQRRYGLTAAQEMLRHSDISITSAHYVENKQRSVLASDICSKASEPSFAYAMRQLLDAFGRRCASDAIISSTRSQRAVRKRASVSISGSRARQRVTNRCVSRDSKTSALKETGLFRFLVETQLRDCFQMLHSNAHFNCGVPNMFPIAYSESRKIERKSTSFSANRQFSQRSSLAVRFQTKRNALA